MNEYRIEKGRVSVALTLRDGTRLVGEVFVQAYARNRHGREEAPDIMNEPEPFFPLASADDTTLLIAKDQVQEIEIPPASGAAPDDETGARPAQVEITLASGLVRSGSVLLELPVDRPRLLDFLNRSHERFLTIQTGDGVRLLNRAMISYVRQMS